MGNEPDALTQMKNTNGFFSFESMQFLQKQNGRLFTLTQIKM